MNDLIRSCRSLHSPAFPASPRPPPVAEAAAHTSHLPQPSKPHLPTTVSSADTSHSGHVHALILRRMNHCQHIRSAHMNDRDRASSLNRELDRGFNCREFSLNRPRSQPVCSRFPTGKCRRRTIQHRRILCMQRETQPSRCDPRHRLTQCLPPELSKSSFPLGDINALKPITPAAASASSSPAFPGTTPPPKPVVRVCLARNSIELSIHCSHIDRRGQIIQRHIRDISDPSGRRSRSARRKAPHSVRPGSLK